MGMTMISENLNNQEEDPEIEEEARGIESLPALENPLIQENPKGKDKDLEVDKVDRMRTTEGPKMKTIDKNSIDQKMKEVEGIEVTMVQTGLEG